ncbi:MAG TPA: hypothetical protein VF989_07725 [Polyangiaceae bacterium]
MDNPPCPACGSSDVIPIEYGYPLDDKDLMERHRRDEAAIGGCLVGRPGGDPAWQCKACRNEFGSKDDD